MTDTTDRTGADDVRGADDAARAAVLVDAVTLAAALGGDEPPVLLDVRWALGRTDGHEQYLAGHLPGAVYVDLDTELAAPPSAEHGRHPLPDVAALEAAAEKRGRLQFRRR